MLQSLRVRYLVGADLCEVAPMYDLTGQTALNAANLLFECGCGQPGGSGEQQPARLIHCWRSHADCVTMIH
jgi:Arginase family